MEVIKQEIFSQTEALLKTQEKLYAKKEEILQLMQQPYRNLVFLGCGSGYMLSSSGAAMFSTHTEKKAVALAGGAVMLNPAKYKEVFADALVIITSRSGETSEVVYSLRELKKITNFKTLGILAKEECTLKDMMDLVIEIPWAYDYSVCQTRNISNFYYALSMLFAFYTGNKALEESFDAFFAAQPEYMKMLQEDCQKIAPMGWKNVTVLADGEVCGIASEGGLAFTEISILPGDYSNILDYRHGPLVLVNPEKLMIVLLNPGKDEYQKKLIGDLKAKNGYVITLGMGDKAFWGSDYHIDLEFISNYEVWGLAFINLCQIMAFYKALALGHDPDMPEGLNPFVKF